MYNEYIHKIRNMCLLEKSINTKVGEKSPHSKCKDYIKSSVEGTRKLGYKICEKGFDRSSVEERTRKIIEFSKKRWKI